MEIKFLVKPIKDKLSDYFYIQKMINSKKSGFATKEFRKVFNRLYSIRSKSDAWYNAYYNVFNLAKIYNYSFEEIITRLYNDTGEVHPIFSSKIITTINPNMPSWNVNTLHWLGIIKDDPKDAKDKIKYYVSIYENIVNQYQKHLEDASTIQLIEKFDMLIGDEGKNLTPTKKIDFIFYSAKPKEVISIFEYNKLLNDYEKLKNTIK